MNYYVECPVHGKQYVSIETKPNKEFFELYTAPCPVCGKRLTVYSERD